MNNNNPSDKTDTEPSDQTVTEPSNIGDGVPQSKTDNTPIIVILCIIVGLFIVGMLYLAFTNK